MKKFFCLLILFICIKGTSQVSNIAFKTAAINTDIKSTSIQKGDTVDIYISYENNGSHTRTIYFDFQYNYKTYTILDAETIPFSNNSTSALPSGATSNLSVADYHGYTYLKNANNNTRNGNVNYNGANYSYNQNSNNAIYRSYLSITSNNDLVDGDILKLRLKINNLSAGTQYDSIYMNFAACWDKSGTYTSSYMPDPKSTFINLDAAANALVTGNLYMNAACPNTYLTFIDSTTGVFQAVAFPNVAGDFKLSTELKPNTAYKVLINVDSLNLRTSYAVTVSDATAALNEFGNQNIDGTFNNTNIMTGVGYLAADVNYNGRFDGADPYLLLAEVASTNTFQSGLYLMQRDSFNVLSTSNWNRGIKDYIYFKTSTINQNLNLNYLIAGDVNRSHSSQVVAPDGTIKSFSFVNTPNVAKSPIVVNLNNSVVTNDYISIPFTIDAGTMSVCGLQFEISYDSTKLTLDTLQSYTNASWLNFYKNANGNLKFGGIDKTLKEPLSGKATPFIARFKAKTPAADINTNIFVTDNMDAADNKGNQLGINLNNNTIKIIGINNFK